MAKFSYKTEDEWADVSLEERARKMASVSLPQMLEALQVNEQIEKAKRKSNG